MLPKELGTSRVIRHTSLYFTTSVVQKKKKFGMKRLQETTHPQITFCRTSQ